MSKFEYQLSYINAQDCEMCRDAYGLEGHKADVLIEWDFQTQWYLCHSCSQHEIWQEVTKRLKG